MKHVVDKGKSQIAEGQGRRELLQPRRLNSVLIAEAIRNAQQHHRQEGGHRRGRAARLRDAQHHRGALEGARPRGLRGADHSVTCADHNGHHSAYMQQWDGTKWVKVSDWIAPMKDKVRPLLEAAAKDYVVQEPGWPKRTEPCDKSS